MPLPRKVDICKNTLEPSLMAPASFGEKTPTPPRSPLAPKSTPPTSAVRPHIVRRHSSSAESRRRLPGWHRPPLSLLRASARFPPPPCSSQVHRSSNPGALPLPSSLLPRISSASVLQAGSAGGRIPAGPLPVSIAPLRLCFPLLPLLHRSFAAATRRRRPRIRLQHCPSTILREDPRVAPNNTCQELTEKRLESPPIVPTCTWNRSIIGEYPWSPFIGVGNKIIPHIHSVLYLVGIL
jgi:hypothetical protein